MGLKKHKNQSPYKIEATLERFEDRYAILKTDDGYVFKWPIKYLPENLNPCDRVILKAGSDETEENEKLEAMRKLLEELIN